MPNETLPPAAGKTPKKKRGCLGCLKCLGILILVFLVFGGIAAALVFRVPQRLGIIPNAAKKYLVSTPDRGAGEELLAEAQARGLSSQGVSLFVLPYKDGEGAVASAVLDSREGFAFTRTEGTDNPVGQVFAQIAGGPTAAELGIEYVTVTYLNAKGQDLMLLSASRADAMAFANGAITGDEFMDRLNGDWNLPAMVGEQIDSMNRMLQ